MFARKTICVVTGASRGLGKSIAVNVATKMSSPSVIILLSRDMNAMEEVKKQIASKCNVGIVVKQADLSTRHQGTYDQLIADCLAEVNKQPQDFEQAVIFHNAGSLGPIAKRASELADLETVSEYFDLNLSGVIVLNANFLSLFRSDSCHHRYVINISSLAALSTFKSYHLYGAGKAARDMFFRVLASEDETLRVLNYAPGPLKTEMTDLTADTAWSEETRTLFKSMFDDNELLECDFTVGKLLGLLEKDEFPSGAHIDLYDI